MTAAIAIIITSICLLYACLLWYIFLKKEEKQRKYQIERLKVEMIITNYQIKELERLTSINEIKTNMTEQ